MKECTQTGSSEQNRGRTNGGSDRGLSDVVAFVLTFGIIIASMALVSTAGIDQLTQLRDAEQFQTAERSMQAAAEEIDHLSGGDPFRTLGFSLNDGDLWVNDSRISVNVTGDGGGGWNYSSNVSSLEHRFDSSRDVSIAYESGAVMRSDGATPSYAPEWYVDNDTAILTLVNITTNETIDVAGGYHRDVVIGSGRAIPQGAPATDSDESLQILAETNPSGATFVENRQLPSGTNATVTVNVSETANPKQWERYLLDRPHWESVPTDDYTFRAEVTDTVLIRETTITLY